MERSINKGYSEMSTQEEQLHRIADALHHWLSYINIVAKSNILLESSLRYALCEYIERQMNVECALEVKHPCFYKRSIDFVWNLEKGVIGTNLDKDTLLADNDNCYILECKYVNKATNSKNERQRVFNDLCRLYYIKKKYPNSHSLFLMAGNAELFSNNFQNAKTNENINWDILDKKKMNNRPNIDEQQNNLDIDNLGKDTEQYSLEPQYRASFSDWFMFDKSGSTSIKTKEPRHSEYYDVFVGDYFKLDDNGIAQNEAEDNISFTTKLLAINSEPPEKGEKGLIPCKFQDVAIWEILIDEQHS